jgi:subtilase family serine protease
MKSLISAYRYASVAIVGVTTLASFGFTPTSALAISSNAEQGQDTASTHRRVCDHEQPEGSAACNARVKVDPSGKPQTGGTPSGLSPAQMRAAYNLGSGVTSVNRTVAVIIAYDNPNIFNDLKTYSTQFGLTQMSNCSVATGTTTHPCFQKVDQNGGTNYPAFNSGWAMESAMDVQTIHAICQNCNILLVEAASNSYSNIFTAFNRAVTMGATVLSNSYSSDEYADQGQYDQYLNRPGIAMTFSSGDAGFGPQFPAASQYVTAVGGTTLNMNGTQVTSETAWSGSGSGCSLYSAKPAFQTDSACANRTIADVSAVADPNTGAAVYFTGAGVGKNGRGSWYVIGGTSLSAPLVAGVYALAGVPSGTQANSLPYSNTSSLRDILTGSNGSCSGSYLCTAQPGFDGPTGLGSPIGLAAF